MTPRVWFSALVAALTWLGVGVTPARADEPKKPSAPYVVVVGVGEFDDKAIDARPTADADAKALYAVLTDPQYLGVPADRAKLLLSKADGKGEKATRDAIVAAINDAAAKTKKDDTIIIAFFGRGASALDKTC